MARNVFEKAASAAKPPGRSKAKPETLWPLEPESELNQTMGAYLLASAAKKSSEVEQDQFKGPLSDECYSRWLDHLAEHGSKPGSTMKLVSGDGKSSVTFVASEEAIAVDDATIDKLIGIVGDAKAAYGLTAEAVSLKFNPEVLGQPVAKLASHGDTPTLYDWLGGRLGGLLDRGVKDGWITREQAESVVICDKKRVLAPGWIDAVAEIGKGSREKIEGAFEAIGGVKRFVKA